MREPSGDQIGEELSCAASNVNRDGVVLSGLEDPDVAAIAFVAMHRRPLAVGRQIDARPSARRRRLFAAARPADPAQRPIADGSGPLQIAAAS